MKRTRLLDLEVLSEQRILMYLVVWGVLASLQFFCLGPGSYIRIHDNADSNHPIAWSRAHHPSLVGGGQFDPTQLAGVERLNPVSGPYIALQQLAPGWAGFALFMLLQRVMAAVSMYLMVRHVMGLDRPVAFSAGLLYPFLIALTELGIYHQLAEPGIPLYVFLLHRLAQVKEVVVSLAASLILGGAVAFSTSLFVSQPFLAAVIAFTLLVADFERWRRYLVLGLTFGLGMAFVYVPTVVSTMAVAGGSQRLAIADAAEALPLTSVFWKIRGRSWDIALLAAPLFLVVFSGFLSTAWRGRVFRFYLFGLAYCGFLVFIQEWLLIELAGCGVFRSFQSDRFYHYTFFFLVLTAATAHQSWRCNSQQLLRGAVGWILPSLASISLLPPAYLAVRATQVNVEGLGSSRLASLAVAAGLVVIGILLTYRLSRTRGAEEVARSARRGVLVLLLITAVVALVGRFTRDITSEEKYSDLFSRSAYAYAAAHITAGSPYRAGTIFPTQNRHPLFAQLSGLETIDGYSSIYSMRFHRFWRKVIEGSTRRNARVERYFFTWGQRVYLFGDARWGLPSRPDQADTFINLDLLSLANVRFLFAVAPIGGRGLELVYTDIGEPDSLYVYENRNAMPRVFAVPRAEEFRDADSLLERLGHADIELLRQVVLVEEQVPPRAAVQNDTGLAWAAVTDLLEYASNRVTVRNVTTRSGYLVLTNNWTKYWSASVNGTPVKILPAYHTFMAVPVEAGESIVAFVYKRPPSIIPRPS